MALEPLAGDIITKLADSGTLPNRRVLCLGYPDILTTGDPSPDAERQSIAKWHHWHGGIEHAEHFFGRQSLTAEYWDVVKARGPEWVVDLNVLTMQTCPTSLKFGLCIDPGTSEHIFNVGNVFALLSQITALNGYVLHLNPLGMGNHGFWGLNPTAYSDFYEANGFSVEMLAELSGPLEQRSMRPIPQHKRFDIAQNGVMLCLVKKISEVPLIWPIQTKYKKNPTLKIAV